jgi:hypothetical protein
MPRLDRGGWSTKRRAYRRFLDDPPSSLALGLLVELVLEVRGLVGPAHRGELLGVGRRLLGAVALLVLAGVVGSSSREGLTEARLPGDSPPCAGVDRQFDTWRTHRRLMLTHLDDTTRGENL